MRLQAVPQQQPERFALLFFQRMLRRRAQCWALPRPPLRSCATATVFLRLRALPSNRDLAMWYPPAVPGLETGPPAQHARVRSMVLVHRVPLTASQLHVQLLAAIAPSVLRQVRHVR